MIFSHYDFVQCAINPVLWLGKYLLLYHRVRRITGAMMKSATEPVSRPQNVFQYSTAENNLKNRIEGMTHCLRNLLCYTVV